MRLAILAAALLTSTAAFAADAPPPYTPPTTDISKAPSGHYVVEKDHASITFKVMHMGYAYYTMRFNDFDASIDLDRLKPEKSKVNVTIRPASLDSNNPKLTEHVSAKEFFDIAQYPTITFASTSIEKTDASHGKVHGNLTMHGVTKPIVLDATFNGGGPHMMYKKYDLGFSATTTVKRSEFGMGYGVPMVGDDILVSIETEFLQE
jgi:polyisoprenoid-binding protein YceI